MQEAENKKKIHTILVTSNDENYAFDKKYLTDIGCQIQNRFSSGNAAIDYLQFNHTNLVIADIKLKDCTVQTFIRNIIKDGDLRRIPVVVISSDSSKAFVLETVASGCSGFIIRPYNLETLRNHLYYLVEIDKFGTIEEELIEEAEGKIRNGDFDQAIVDFKEIVETESDEAKEYFDQGVKYLVEKKYAKAIVAFKKVLKINDMFIKAYRGLANAYRGKGDMEQYQYYMQQAAEEYARLNEFEEVKSIFVQILKFDDNAPNPYNTLGIKLRKEKKYDMALDAYKQALKLDPYDENIYYNFARALYFSNYVDSSVKCLKKALKLNRDFEEARQLYHKISGKEWDG